MNLASGEGQRSSSVRRRRDGLTSFPNPHRHKLTTKDSTMAAKKTTKKTAKPTAKKTTKKTRTTGSEPYFGDCRSPENRAKRDAWRAKNQ